MADEKPEGTDTIIEGAGVGGDDERGVPIGHGMDRDGVSEQPDGERAAGTGAANDTDGEVAEAQSFSERVDSLRGQAGDRAREFVTGAKDRVTGSMDDIVRLIEDAAAEVDGKVGQNYGDYIRRAAGSVSGMSDALKDKDVDALFADAGELVRKAPGVAIGAAAAIGFVMARLARAGLSDTNRPSEDVKAV